MIGALLLAAATLALRAPFSHARVEGFSKDGKTAVFEASIDAPAEAGREQIPWGEDVWVGIGDDGRPLHVARYVESRADDVAEDEVELTPEAQRLWKEAEPVESGHRLRDLVLGVSSPFLAGAQGTLTAGAKARVERSGPKACPAVRLFVSMAGREAIAFEDPCVEGETGEVGMGLSHAANATGTALALAWTVMRGDVGHARIGVVTAANLAALDLLAAGGDPEAAADKLAAAGFRVAHRAAAVKKRGDTAVYFAPGFEDEAKGVAQALGAPASAVQPLSWKTPYAVTVALGSN
ncbi:MAG: LytR C-terminal domain-containing protein [Myxococcales bacterium]